MRIIIKGGVWKNTEDEILKVAVMKYGKNQWARISSLLVRKTPAQCKARWYEWLDPSIKKTEWSKEEDEKLLHLAKLMPTQWRTIAPIVGRTAAQCLERYQKLLDDAEREEDSEGLSLTGDAGGEHGPATADDVRKLRPGEVDPDPETKPARPDPVDMDEDEKEMLSEARARLANTQGKKAKRKAREKQLLEARRLALLQKRRELKASGIRMRLRVPKGQMDYNAEIPFEKQPASGFYDTSGEQTKDARSKPFNRASLQDHEGGKRRHELEEEARKQDARKLKERKEAQGGVLFSPEQAAKEQREREEDRIAKRRKLTLPAPQVGDAELEGLVKMGMSTEASRALLLNPSDDSQDAQVTSELMGDYSSTLGSVRSARTPRTPAVEDHIRTEARMQRARMEQQTPLLGGFQGEDEEAQGGKGEGISGEGTGFGGITPARPSQATPNPMLTPFRSSGGPSDPRFTPRRGLGPSAGGIPKGAPSSSSLPLTTPIRDQMGINTPGGDVEDGPRGLPVEPEGEEMDSRLAQARRRLISDLANLPAPKNDYDIVLPDEEREEEEVMENEGQDRSSRGTYLQKEDAEEADRRRASVRKAAEEARLKRRTMTLQKSLPRPLLLDPSYLLDSPDGEERDWASDQVAREMARLMVSDALEDPVPGGKVLGLGDSQGGLEKFTDAELVYARELMTQEIDESSLSFLENDDQLRKEEMAYGYLPKLIDEGKGGAGRKRVMVSMDRRDIVSSEDRMAMARAEWARIGRALSKEVGAADRLESRLDTLLKGHQNRAKELRERMDQASEALGTCQDDQVAFTSLAHLETRGAPLRLDALHGEVSTLRAFEAAHQARYAQLSRDRWAVYDRCRRIYERLHPMTTAAGEERKGLV
ncbi:pre-mRNA splicing factor component-domain-containing protein [Piptocephalis cylindrospora]|uniref:Pre-mRNA splicing factor component-domain-containing protein n=1 Tax=Piptocephalis cylindrospora TaxID=1907219 RepID=A0A4P9Y776_9FUNG|nr:pre-mRNA splicing factor component-domain-containing protein [Piptocephalis cylindrospora]|eukprot:RKP14081.1 pre-mRNA splicing factor component-domain-containing protein [Piptocephalis cylindrospora]